MNSVTAAVAIAIIGLIGPLLAFQNGRFSGPTSRAERIETLTRITMVLESQSVERRTMQEVLNRAIAEEHERTFGPKLRWLILVFYSVAVTIGVLGITNFFDNIFGGWIWSLLIAQVCSLIAASKLEKVHLQKSDEYFNHLGDSEEDENETASHKGRSAADIGDPS